jgi:hypothetical protein
MKQGINANSHVEAYANVQTCTNSLEREREREREREPVQKTRKRFLLCAASLRTSKTTLEKP